MCPYGRTHTGVCTQHCQQLPHIYWLRRNRMVGETEPPRSAHNSSLRYGRRSQKKLKKGVGLNRLAPKCSSVQCTLSWPLDMHSWRQCMGCPTQLCPRLGRTHEASVGSSEVFKVRSQGHCTHTNSIVFKLMLSSEPRPTHTSLTLPVRQGLTPSGKPKRRQSTAHLPYT